MRGRHRRRGPRPLGILLLLVVVAGAGGAAYVYRDDLGDLTGLWGGEEARAPAATPAPTVQPSRAPSPAPRPEPTSPSPAEPRRGRLVIHGTGDVSLDPSYIPALAESGYGHAWSGLGGLFEDDDLTVVNLECAVSDLGVPLEKEFTFRCDPAALPAMRRAGVEVANLANNHSRDFGPEALLDSRRNLRAAGIAPVGVGPNARVANRPAIFEIKGWRVAVLGFGGVVPAADWLAGPGHPGMADGDDVESMVAAVEAADRVADLVFVTVHWGMELETEPSPDDVERAHAMIDAGADGIFGHHSHRLGPLDHYRGRPIAWSLGNFVWPFLGTPSATTAVAEFTVTPEGRVRGRLIPAFIESSGHPVLVH